MFEIASVDRSVIEQALKSRISDFEDAVLDEAGYLAGVEAIITRNNKDFVGSKLRVFDPVRFVAQFSRKDPVE